MKRISSPRAFKPCYIAEVKEEMGLLRGRRVNRRKVRAPERMKRLIRKAIEVLGEGATYRAIQEKALEIYLKEYGKEVDEFFGILRVDDREAFRALVEDEEVFYES